MTSPMLQSLLRDSLDPGYAESAARNRASDTPPRPQWPLVIAGVLLLGLIIGVAYADTRAAAPSSERARQALLVDVQRESQISDHLQDRLESLSADVAAARDTALTVTEEGRAQLDLVQRLEAAAAAIGVTGPGVTVVVADAESGQQTDPVSGEEITGFPDEAGRVLDIDLQAVVNALWAAGAEAISVGGQRLAPTTTIRTAGEAILVDFRPVSSPYMIEAIGDPDRLLTRFMVSDTASRFTTYQELYGIGFEVASAGELSLRAATGTELRYAEPVTEGQK
ncbi:DUF881 domain-containing protein [soil metagenome]